MIRTYSQLARIPEWEERINFLKLCGVVGSDTFGFERIFNQRFYNSREWRRVRRDVIVRDNGCDLGIQDRPIAGKIYVHHMEPITMEDLESGSERLLSPEYLISVSADTHNLIHFGYIEKGVPLTMVDRTPGDTCPWKKG